MEETSFDTRLLTVFLMGAILGFIIVDIQRLRRARQSYMQELMWEKVREVIIEEIDNASKS